MRKTAATFLVVLAATLAFGERQPFERYQSILDRQMFGELPPGFDPTKSPAEVARTAEPSQKELTKEQEKVKSAIHFSVINVTPEGDTAIGFTDNTDPKTPVHYYLKVGEESNGWLVKEADPKEASMTIAKDGIEVSLKLGGDSAKDGGTAKAGGAAPGSPAAFAGRGRPGGLFGGSSLRARRLQRQQADAAAQAKAEKQAEQARAAEQERQQQAEEERAQREQERAEQRQQLLAIQEELRRVREQKAAERKESENGAEEQ